MSFVVPVPSETFDVDLEDGAKSACGATAIPTACG